ncbi:MAG: hypothetical protein Q8Q88_17440 [Phenylobacterium sp.]|uniref:hypothetical protein n=1 Tax=Phenylobacterium sp. TaxID=1871053 RepID=UPI0027368962|nr:hypothetical protein [Phenylobacterium sp.]MDP3748825.1 hypothetical protein [Phenylobacterium sp.]
MAVLSHSHVPVTQSEFPWAIRRGALAGVMAGVVFAIFEMVASAAMMGVAETAAPLRMIGAIALGPQALDPAYSLTAASLAGLAVHLVLSVIYGGAFAAIAGGLRPRPAIVGLATAYGFALWLLNFYLIAPAAFPWFAAANAAVQFVAHTVFFGAVLGYYLWRSHEALLRRTA